MSEPTTTPEQRAYGRGYAAASKRVRSLESEIERLKAIPPKPAGKSETIEYLLHTAEVLTQAARLLIEMEARGYKCTGCGHTQPKDHFFYTARNAESSEEVTPLCAPCVRGGLARVMGAPWQHQGPFEQSRLAQLPQK